MNYRKFGRTGLKVSEIGFGAWGIGGHWGKRDNRKAREAIEIALDLGINFFDTAFAYGEGHSERLIGKVIRAQKCRDQVFLATKIPPRDYQWPADPSSRAEKIFPPRWIRQITEMSLRNLRVSCLDLQQLHVWNPRWLKEPEWMEEMRKLQKEGKIRWIGVSVNDHEPDSALPAIASGFLDSVQVIYNIFDQTAEKRLLTLCHRREVAVIARAPFDEGGLTGTLKPTTRFSKNDWRQFYFEDDRLSQTCKRVERLKSLLGREAQSLPELALRFSLSHPSVSTVIPGMRRPSHVRMNMSVSDGRALSPRLRTLLMRHAWEYW